MKCLRDEFPDFFQDTDEYLGLAFGLFIDSYRCHESGTYSKYVFKVECLNLPPEVGMH